MRKKNTLSPLKGDHCKRKCLYSKFQSSIFRGYRYVRGVVISNLWWKHLLFSNWTSLLTDRTPRKRLDFAGDSPSLNRLHFWLCLPRQSPSPAREWLHQWTAERWMTNPLDQFASVYELEWRFHSIPFIFDGNPPSKNELLMSICSDCAGSNVSIHSMVLASYLPCTACHFVATHTQTLSSLPLKPCWVFWPKNETAFKKHEEIFLKATCNSSTHFSQPSNRLVYPQ